MCAQRGNEIEKIGTDPATFKVILNGILFMQRNASQFLIVFALFSWVLSACNSNDSSDNSGNTLNFAAAPQNVNATPDSNQVTISWDAVEAATDYKIYWSLAPNVNKSNGTPVEAVQSAYIHSNLSAGDQHHYIVVAIDANGEGLPSAEVAATPTGALLTVNSTDNNLNNCIQSLASQNDWQYADDVTGVLDCSFRGINNISGLQQFRNLEGINLSNNDISDLEIFQSFTKLKSIDLSNNNLGKQNPTVISSLIELSTLTSLSLSGNPQFACADLDTLITSLGSALVDISSVQTGVNCTSYTTDSGNNPNIPTLETWPTKVEAVPGNNKVTLNWNDAEGATTYRIYWNNQAGVSPLSGNLIDNVASGYIHTGLSNYSNYYYIVTAITNGIESEPSSEVSAIPSDQGMLLAGLFTDANLQACVDAFIATKAWTFAHELTVSLDCSSKGIVDLSGLENLTALRNLNLSNNNITDLSAIQTLSSLSQLLLNNNSVVDISALVGLPALSILNLRNNAIVDIISLNSTNTLTELYLSNNQIINVGAIGIHTNLTTLDIRNNAIGGEGVGNVDSLATLGSAKRILISGNANIACAELQAVVNSLGPNIVDIAPNQTSINCSGIPNTPRKVRVIPGDQKNIVTWDGVIGAQSYNIYWANTAGVTTATGSKIAGVAPGYSHNGLNNGTPYYYIVTAENASGESQPSVEVFSNPQMVLISGLFKDSNLQLCVDELAVFNGWTTVDQITGSLNCSYQNIQDISGLENLQGLTRLSLNTNTISDISAIANLNGLRVLSLYDNTVQDMSVIAGLVNLTDLFLSGNHASSVQSLANIPNLNTLDLRENQIGAASVGHVDSLVNLNNAAQIQLLDNPTMSCPELAVLLANIASGVLDITSPQPGVNCSDPALVPNNVYAVSGDGQITLSWDGLEGINDFYLYWSTSPSIDVATATRFPVIGNSFVHKNLTNDTTYYYVVTSKIGEGESGISEEVAGVPSVLGVALLGLFPDTNLAACVNGVAAPNGWKLSHEVTGTLNCSSTNITDLTGMEYLTSVQVLRLGSNNITDISSLSTLSGLEFLDLYSNQIDDISAIGGMTGLTTLYLHNNNITNADSLANLPILQYLILDGNYISDSTPIGNITSLTELFYRNNGVTSIAGFSQLPQLTALYLNNNQISDVSSVGSLVLLKQVDLRNNIVGGIGVGKIDSLSSLVNVSQIWLSGNANISCSELTTLVDALGPAVVDVGLPQPGVNCSAP